MAGAKRPKWGADRAELERVLSPEAYAELCEKFGGRRIRVPRPTVAARRLRRALEVLLLEGDHTYSATAATMGVSVSTVTRDAKRAG